MARGIKNGFRAYADCRVKGIIRPYRNLNCSSEVEQTLRELRDEGVDGIIISPALRTENFYDILDEMAKSGVAVCYLLNEIEGIKAAGNVRMNGRLCGRIAAQLIGLCNREGGDVAVLVSSNTMKLHRECRNGFIEEAKKYNLNIVGVYETLDDKNISYHVTKRIIDDFPNLRGIYVSSYNSVGTCEYLDEIGRHEVTVIGQDLYPALVEKLENGTLVATLFQNQEAQGYAAVKHLYEYIADIHKTTFEVMTTPVLVMSSNLEGYREMY